MYEVCGAIVKTVVDEVLIIVIDLSYCSNPIIF
jgi:hypothetical protein